MGRRPTQRFAASGWLCFAIYIDFLYREEELGANQIRIRGIAHFAKELRAPNSQKKRADIPPIGAMLTIRKGGR